MAATNIRFVYKARAQIHFCNRWWKGQWKLCSKYTLVWYLANDRYVNLQGLKDSRRFHVYGSLRKQNTRIIFHLVCPTSSLLSQKVTPIQPNLDHTKSASWASSSIVLQSWCTSTTKLDLATISPYTWFHLVSDRLALWPLVILLFSISTRKSR